MVPKRGSSCSGWARFCSRHYAWTLRTQNPGLLRAVDGFVRNQFGSDTYQVLAQRYFDEPRFSYINGLAHLSPYDNLVRRYAESIGRRIPGISHEVIRLFKAHAWPGNVRELDNEVRRMVALAENGEFLSNKHLSPDMARLAPGDPLDHHFVLNGGGSLKEIVERLEMRLVSEALHRNKWNHSKVARELGLSRVGLANKIKRYTLNQNGKQG